MKNIFHSSHEALVPLTSLQFLLWRHLLSILSPNYNYEMEFRNDKLSRRLTIVTKVPKLIPNRFSFPFQDTLSSVGDAALIRKMATSAETPSSPGN